MSDTTPIEEPVSGPEGFQLSDDFVRQVLDALDAGQSEKVAELARPLHTADLAHLMDILGSEERRALVQVLRPTLDPELLAYLAPEVRDEVVDVLGAKESAAAIAQLDTDDAVYVIEDLEEEGQKEILQALPEETRAELEEGLAYPDSSAGRLMQKRFVSIPEYWTVGDTIDFLRRSENLPGDFYQIFVVDPKLKPVGGVMLSRLMRNQRHVPVRSIMSTDLRPIETLTDQEQVAFAFRKYALVEAPVVNKEGRMVGVITVDDVVDVMQEEAEEDLMRMGGVVEGDFYSALVKTVGLRFPWLFVNLLTAFTASLVVGMFAHTIEQIVALAVLMPVVASMGGNAGIQASTVAVRALAMHELTDTNAWRAVTKEFLVGSANGLLFCIICGLAAVLRYGDVRLGMVFGGAMLLTLVFAGLAGVLIPLALHRARQDPALAAGVFLTTVTDIVGFFVFLGLGAWFLA